MNKRIIKTLSTLSLFILVGCQSSGQSNSSNSNSSSINNSSSQKNSTSSSTSEKTFKQMLKEISNKNITYHSDFFIYYYEIGDNERLKLQHFDVYAKITEDLYDVMAYHVDSGLIEAYQHLERDAEGYVTYSDVNINNEVETFRAKDGKGNDFLWEESVYYNLIRELDVDDFEQVEEDRYRYQAALNETPLNILHSAIPTSHYEMDYFDVIVKDNKIDSFIMQEKESDDVYAGCMYGRVLTIKFEDIGTTKIERIKPYEEKEENASLGLALKSIRTKNNYTIESTGILDDGSVLNFQETYITEKDILQTQHLDTGDYDVGCHTYNDELYIFETIKGYMIGEKAEASTTVSSFIPTFSFSEHVFEYLGEKEGYKVYRPYQTMKTVLDYVDVMSYYGEAYYSPAGTIEFFVKDNELAKIEFPVYVYNQADPLIALNRLTYKDFNQTVINDEIWDSFYLELPKIETSWDVETFDFYYSDNEKEELSIGDVLYKCLGDSTLLPYFLQDTMYFDVYGNYSESDECVYITLEPLLPFTSEDRQYAKSVLKDGAGFRYSTNYEDPFTIDKYRGSGIKVDIIFNEEYSEIVIELPIGNILEK